ncbi:MAG: DegT/DnrJ/EryC1/StrS aminotransferase family protein [Sulfurospirillum sp.]|nr:DegT/DnrJ/EryC1/StrS aminotransferase family protein [Sulfurospirillum sp.]MBL0703441.1 DegT/DnrJ/EryC1/StrS aminotransferase family protein [Sulfurospirillum sp.]
MNEIPFYKPYIDSSEKKLINEVLELNKTSKIDRLEKDFSLYVGSKYSLSTCNGTAAMHLAMCALNLKRGDKVICSVNSFSTLAEVVRHFDAEPIFVDIDKEDFNMDMNELEKVLEKNNHKKLKAIFVTHVAGQIANLNRIYELASIFNVKVVEDASQALGATYEGKKIGSTGSDITTFKFSQQTKNAISNGGIMATDKKNLMQRAKLLRNHAIVSDGWDKYGNLGYVYDVVDIGLKYDLNELNAAYAVAQLNKNDIFIKRRLEIVAIYNKELKNCPHVSIPIKKNSHVYSEYIIKIDKNRDSFAKKLKKNGIFTSLHFIPIHLLSYYKHKYSLRVNDFPNALTNYQQILSLPIYTGLTNKEVYFICEKIKNIAKSCV